MDKRLLFLGRLSGSALRFGGSQLVVSGSTALPGLLDPVGNQSLICHDVNSFLLSRAGIGGRFVVGSREAPRFYFFLNVSVQ
jgi:hypothetical protein